MKPLVAFLVVVVLTACSAHAAGPTNSTDWVALQTRAGNFAGHAIRERDPDKREGLYRQAIDAYETALAAAQFSGDKARIQRDMGFCEVFLADMLGDSDEGQRLLRQAVQRFEAASDTVTGKGSAPMHGLWGVALIRIGKQDQDRMKLRQAAVRLQTAVDLAPDNPEYRYNLACAYALTGSAQSALQHLEVCLQNDKKGRYKRTARTDRDLDSLRLLPGFRKLGVDPLLGPDLSGSSR